MPHGADFEDCDRTMADKRRKATVDPKKLAADLRAVAVAVQGAKRKAPRTAFKKGNPKPPGSGRAKGTPNKFTGTMRQAAMEAFGKIDGVEWLAKIAKSNSPANRRAMVAFFGKMLPLQVTGEEGGPVVIQISESQKDV